jgi:catechol 2,3-dioxygenase-like lactoylglutathione lyase family enzyme
MRATGFTHVSVHAYDLEASTRFYVELFGMRRVPAPDFEHPVIWLEVGELQLHLFLRDTPAPEFHHIGLDVDDFEAVYRQAKELDILDTRAFGTALRGHPKGWVQLYIRDPAGNLVEVNWPDASTLDPAILAEMTPLENMAHQEGDAAVATLYHS